MPINPSADENPLEQRKVKALERIADELAALGMILEELTALRELLQSFVQVSADPYRKDEEISSIRVRDMTRHVE